ncbi:hypothetical protein WUBG_08847 [Wuchereria bancrofti]|uniref:Uncharacterized protein n=1 Tax=Wuchereria bancrofti TaxID=6293 RepID=J9EYL9_WUCBA|nr:hypothetical protein WUBG_08847 [Wuchereria bancrofti]
MPKIQDPRKLKSAFLKWMMIFKRRHHILVIDSMVSSTSKLVRLGEEPPIQKFRKMNKEMTGSRPPAEAILGGNTKSPSLLTIQKEKYYGHPRTSKDETCYKHLPTFALRSY